MYSNSSNRVVFKYHSQKNQDEQNQLPCKDAKGPPSPSKKIKFPTD